MLVLGWLNPWHLQTNANARALLCLHSCRKPHTGTFSQAEVDGLLLAQLWPSAYTSVPGIRLERATHRSAKKGAHASAPSSLDMEKSSRPQQGL